MKEAKWYWALAIVALPACGVSPEPSPDSNGVADESAEPTTENVGSVSEALSSSIVTKPFNSANIKWLASGRLHSGTGVCAYRTGDLLGTTTCGTTAIGGLTYTNQEFTAYQQKTSGAVHICERDGLELQTTYQICTRQYFDSYGKLLSTKQENCGLQKYVGRNCITAKVNAYGKPTDVRLSSTQALGENYSYDRYGAPLQTVVNGVTKWREPYTYGYGDLTRLNYLADKRLQFRIDFNNYLTAKPAPSNIVILAGDANNPYNGTTLAAQQWYLY